MRRAVLTLREGTRLCTVICSHPDRVLLIHARDSVPMDLDISLEGIAQCEATGAALCFETRAL